MEGAIAKLILDSMENSNGNTGTLGDAFQKLLTSQKELTLEEQEELVFESKIKELKKYEVAKDLAWIDYTSWNVFPKPLQDQFIQHLDPLQYGGIFFQYSKMVSIETELFRLLPSDCFITVLRDSNNYRLVCTGADDARYDWLGVQAMSNLQKDFESRTIRSIACTSDGIVVEKARVTSGS